MMAKQSTLAVVLIVGCIATSAHAAYFNGSHKQITDFAGGSDVVNNAGTYVNAVNLLNDNVGGVGVGTTINGVYFQGTQPGQFFEGLDTFANGTFVYHGGDAYADPGLWTSNGTAYDVLADSQLYNVDNPNANSGDGYGVINLQPGTEYLLQVFMLDDRSGVDKTFPLQIQEAAFTGNYDQLDGNVPATEIGYMTGITIGGKGTTHASGEVANIRFTVDPGYNGLLVNTWDNGAFNGMQLRSLGPFVQPGDYDHNGTVGPEDYAVWKSSFGSTSSLNADGNGDGIVNAADYTIWRDNLAASGGAGSGGELQSSGVPEPGTGLLSLAAIAIVGGARLGRRLHIGNR